MIFAVWRAKLASLDEIQANRYDLEEAERTGREATK